MYSQYMGDLKLKLCYKKSRVLASVRMPPLELTHHISQSPLLNIEMSEKLFLQWNDLQDKSKGAFENLRDDKDFTDVTLACEDIFERSAIQQSLGHCGFSLLRRSKCFPRDSGLLPGYR